MSYGIEVKNKYNTVIINDTTQTYLPLYTSYQATSPGAAYPPASLLSNDEILIFAAPAVGQNKVAALRPNTSVWDNSAEAPTSYRWIAFKRSDLLTAPTSTYGINIFDGSGDLCYTTVEEIGFRILNIFQVGGRVPTLTFPSQSGTYSNFENIFILMNPRPRSGSSQFGTYKPTWTWVTSTTGRITVAGSNLLGGSGMIVEVLK
jgi:hypothetical protein